MSGNQSENQQKIANINNKWLLNVGKPIAKNKTIVRYSSKILGYYTILK